MEDLNTSASYEPDGRRSRISCRLTTTAVLGSRPCEPHPNHDLITRLAEICSLSALFARKSQRRLSSSSACPLTHCH
jgi:hypothetical protein